MIPLIKMYDDFTSNKYVSLGITVASTAVMGYVNIKRINMISSIAFIVGTCTGIAFALLTKLYVAHNKYVKSDGERYSFYATLSLLMPNFQWSLNPFFRIHVRGLTGIGLSETGLTSFRLVAALNGFGLSFLATNLVLQLMEKPIENKF